MGPWHDAAAVAKTLSKSDLTTISKFEFGKTMLGRRFAKFNCKKCKTSLKTFLMNIRRSTPAPNVGCGSAWRAMHLKQCIRSKRNPDKPSSKPKMKNVRKRSVKRRTSTPKGRGKAGKGTCQSTSRLSTGSFCQQSTINTEKW